MTTYLIEISNCETKNRNIIAHNPILKTESVEYFNRIFQDLQLKHTDTKLEMKISENYETAQIYTVQKEIQTGWVWNSENTNIKILYKLFIIPVCNDFIYNNFKLLNNNPNYNYGYARECFSPEWKTSFLNELIYKLSLPNYGLKN